MSELRFRKGDKKLFAYPFLITLYVETNKSIAPLTGEQHFAANTYKFLNDIIVSCLIRACNLFLSSSEPCKQMGLLSKLFSTIWCELIPHI